jgi:hypothetical protein
MAFTKVREDVCRRCRFDERNFCGYRHSDAGNVSHYIMNPDDGTCTKWQPKALESRVANPQAQSKRT